MKIDRSNFFEHLKERGYVYQTSNEEQVKKLIEGDPITVYGGIDPTADSLHIGHCILLLTLKKFQEAGHRCIVLLGGATAMIGDPSGRNDMRSMISSDFVNNNYKRIEETISRFLKLDGENPAIIVNNSDWIKGYDYIDFMRDIGAHFNVNHMLQSDACASRLKSGGLTFLEMGYMLIQAYDFVHLNRTYNCKLEVGGSDQWGNIIAGVELGRKLNYLEGKDVEAFQGLTTPLLVNSEGKKMGKTAKGSVWVSKDKTSVYDFYQYFVNVKDEDVRKLLVLFTDFEIAEIDRLIAADIREAKKRMAFEVTALIHGREEAQIAMDASNAFFGSGTNLDNVPTCEISKQNFENGLTVIDALTIAKLTNSKSEARRNIEQGGVSLNDEKVCAIDRKLEASDFENGYAILKRGKKSIIK